MPYRNKKTGEIISDEEARGRGVYSSSSNISKSVIEEPRNFGQGLYEAGSGFAKEAASIPFRAMELGKSLAYGGGKLLQKVPIAPIQSAGKKITDYQEQGQAPNWLKSISQRPELLTPKTNAEKVGAGIENIGEFLVPTGLEAKGAQYLNKATPYLETGLTKLDKIIKGGLNLAGKSLGSGAEFASKTAIQTNNLEESKRAGIIGLATPPVVKGITSTANKIAPVVANVLAGMIGKDPEHIFQAFKNPEIVAKRMAEKVIPLQVREKAVSALNSFREAYQNTFQQGIDNISKIYENRLAQEPLTVPFAGNEAKQKMLNSLKSTLRTDAKVGVDKKGVLDFMKTNKSSIVSPTEQNRIQQVYTTLNNQKDFSVKGMQDTAARINALSTWIEGDRTQSSRLVSEIHSKYSKFIDKMYPELGSLRKQYGVDKEIANGIDEILKSVKNEVANPTAVTTSTKKLSNLFAEDNEAYLDAIKRLEEVSGTDLLNDLAASEFKNLLPKKGVSLIGGAGVIAGGAWSNPLILAALPLFSPKLVGKITTTAGKLSPFITPSLKSIPKTITPLINQ